MNDFRPFFYLIGLAVVIFFIWYFNNIFIYLVISAILSIIGRPIIHFYDRIRIGRFKIPHSLCALMTLITMLVIFCGFILFFVPLITSQASVISQINLNKVLTHFQEPLIELENFLVQYNVINSDETIESALENQIQSAISIATFSNIFKHIVTTTGTFFIGAFSILFITFFFLKDEKMIKSFFLLITPEEHERKMHKVLYQTKKLLSNYFLGLLTEVGSMIALLSIGLWIFGIKNAFLIGFLGGLLNIIPYLGPIIGTIMGMTFIVSADLSVGDYNLIFNHILEIVGVFLVANLIDNMVLQPLIYSNSVKARPIEIFLIIIIAASIAGVGGMILAIPTYTIIRIFGREFLSQFRIIKAWTERL
ncbi:MAG: AI-2E family transporter [Hyphomicrobiales bacterium]